MPRSDSPRLAAALVVAALVAAVLPGTGAAQDAWTDPDDWVTDPAPARAPPAAPRAPAPDVRRLLAGNGIGTGVFSVSSADPSRRDSTLTLVSLDARLGGYVAPRLGLYFFGHLGLAHFDVAGRAYRRLWDWVGEKPEQRAILGAFASMGLLFSPTSSVVAGPGLTFHPLPPAESLGLGLDLGFGVAGLFVDAENGRAIVGNPLLLGVSFEPWRGGRVALQAVWEPPALHWRWTPSRDHVLAVSCGIGGSL